MKKVYPTKESHPDYICINKACKVLKHMAAQGHWDEWSETTQLIVDTFHYGKHWKEDVLCRKWWNPAPTDGSAPNLVIKALASDGSTYDK
ncbi:uncharacterized protein LACBIDRAFT_318626 [Laccaria bicolor S238N-H82]|uniref:Predicted protein n=1 Tax=Laccaria bicolor (strain S238N-H82 / ATCC MYA-4686) TaxID=486041 RepID=B0E2S8_LACBS|nr:uncharacterized protein LACBIDRAFT_318626 [Laccaria bicolor S238N-H82]EDQ98858.1 predicted protein [Laccaria bicolor S238N-H82]|eukprot:XP_001890493.1 predicted protein [Laccaria bicolor S238N-H82]